MLATQKMEADTSHEHDETNGTTLSTSSERTIHEQDDGTTVDDYKVFNDPVHGTILLHPLLVKIIDTPQFQRLRNIKQLGATYFVYPGASHNRFEHSIGTSHLAGKLARMLQKKQSELNITDVDVLCVEMAGLCHDLGHGPFSHLFDKDFLKLARPGCDWAHEKGSCKMLDHLIEVNNLWPLMKQHKIEENDDKKDEENDDKKDEENDDKKDEENDDKKKDITFVKEMIDPLENPEDKSGKWLYTGRGKDKSFLYEIVSNKRNNVDVDKWDYFARDCHNLGINNSFDHNRFMHFIRVKQVPGERLQICARDKECFNLYEMFHTRSVLHRRAYQHTVCKAIERMICDAMVLADSIIKKPIDSPDRVDDSAVLPDSIIQKPMGNPDRVDDSAVLPDRPPIIHIPGKNGTLLSISQCVDDAVAFTQLNDSIFDKILYSIEPELHPARYILNRILKRQLYKCIGVASPKSTKSDPKDNPKIDPKDIPNQIADCDSSGELKKEIMFARNRNVNYGMEDKNPVDFFMFFSKANPGKLYHMRREDVSPMLPDVFEESEVQVFCTVDDDDEMIKLASECFKKWCKKMVLQPRPITGDVYPLPSTDNGGPSNASKVKKAL